MKPRVVLWDWRSEPVPDAPLVVAALGLHDSEAGMKLMSTGVLMMSRSTIVLPGRDWDSSVDGASLCGLVPALYIERQPDLARLAGLRGTRAKHRAIVVSPREEIVLNGGPCERHERFSLAALPSICDACRAHNIDGIDLIVVTGFDEPLHPAHVRSLVAQAKAAEVPVVLLWGSHISFEERPGDRLSWAPQGENYWCASPSDDEQSLFDAHHLDDLSSWCTRPGGATRSGV